MAGSILWFRQDLRLFDQPAVRAAAQQGPVLPVYVLDDETPGDWGIGRAQRWWLHHSLASLAADLKAKGAPLLLLRGKADEVLARLANETGLTRIHALAHYEPLWQAAEARLAAQLELVLHEGVALAPPHRVTTRSGGRWPGTRPIAATICWWSTTDPPTAPSTLWTRPSSC